jgi:FtsP/CotA-like multicopper oxidase with cupredoxin domain
MTQKRMVAMAWLVPALAAYGIIHCSSALAQPRDCPARPGPSSVVENPPDLIANDGLLKVSLTLRSQEMMEFPLKVCYVDETASTSVEAPTLRVNPGDELDLSLSNHLTYVPPRTPALPPSPAPHDPCSGGTITSTSTNIDFDGLGIPTKCHQGEVSTTTIENTDPPFDYRFRIPQNHPPGMYWYHPHLLGSATLQLNGGASGVLIVGGMEKLKPEISGLPERILVFRQQLEEDESDVWPPDDYRFSLNFQTISPAEMQWPVIRMKPGAKEFWRVANACAQGFLALQLVYGDTAQSVSLVALDGVPLPADLLLKTIELPPGGRAEFIVTAPPAGQDARLVQTQVDTGRTGFKNPPQWLARIITAADAQEPPPAPGAAPARLEKVALFEAGTKTLADLRATKTRSLYLAEATNGTNGPTRFFLAVEGQTPAAFDPSGPPAVTTRVGAVEDWIISNHTGDVHAFHMQHLHFLVLQGDGEESPELRDTVMVPAWDGIGPYPTVKLRMDFRDPRSAGVFEFQDQISHAAEAGMMARIRVNP